MAVISLQVDVDSDVYPELYARLRAIDRPEAREERLRLLAASGLVWEAVRMHGPAATAEPPRVPPAPPAPAATAPRRPPAEVPRIQHVDLAIDVEAPGPPPADETVPLLLDVVHEMSEPMPLDEPMMNATVVPLRADDDATHHVAAIADEDSPLPTPLDDSLRRPAARSARLKRMVDRGLFKNG